MEPRWPDFKADQVLLEQILQNLLQNAINFDTSRPKRIRVGWQEAPEKHAASYDRHNGIGIEPQCHDQISRTCERLHSDREYGGTGIGLAFAAKAAHKMGGEGAYDLVVVDCKLPGMDGLTAFRSLPNGSQLPPFVMLTVAGSESLGVAALKAGV